MVLSVLNLFVFIGGIQGLTLCFFLFRQRKVNKSALIAFLVLMGSLSIFNLIYTLLFLNVRTAIPIGAFPIPYKYLIGIGFYFYMRSLIAPLNNAVRDQFYLLIPAVLYGVIRTYWSYLIFSGKNPDIIREVYDTGFFTWNEFVYLGFNLILIGLILRTIGRKKPEHVNQFGASKKWRWIKQFTIGFLLFTVIHLMIQLNNVLFDFVDIRLFYYPNLIANSIFVYWIGFIGYTNSGLMISKPIIHSIAFKSDKYSDIEAKLIEAMEKEQLYRNPRLTINELAQRVNIPSQDITRYINDSLKLNFSQYLNDYRTRLVMELLKSDRADLLTLEGLAKEAGFNSKASFNKVFKDQTGLTPTEYKKNPG